MLDLINNSHLFVPLKSFVFQDWLYCLLLWISGSIFCSFLIVFYTQNNKEMRGMVKDIFFSKVFLHSCLFCVFDFLFAVFLYGVNLYAYFVVIFLLFLFVMSYIDALVLAVPDFLNFACLIFVFLGLYYLDELKEENFIASFSVAGGLSLLRIFGSFVFRKEVMGEADIVVFASMGAILLLYPSLYLIFLASILAMAYILLVSFIHLKGKQIALSSLKVPFVLFLSLAFVILLFYKHFIGEISV